jgi:3-phenylpropionate/trans-cinnamate dioxygenase ferredoxin component
MPPMEIPMQTEIQKESFSLKRLLIPGKRLIKIADINELEINQVKNVKAKGKNIVLCRTEVGYYALTDKCPHKGSSLSKGVMINSTILCIKCGSQYDVRNGKKKAGPSHKDAQTVRIVVREDGVFV